MPQDTNTADAAQALTPVRVAARKYRAAKGDAKQAARAALHVAVAHAVRAGATQVKVADASGFSKAQVSRVARGGTSGASQLPPAKYLVDVLPANELIERYRSGESVMQLAKAYGCSSTTVRVVLERNNVPRRVGRNSV
jgi:Mor family transcriptional regulator